MQNRSFGGVAALMIMGLVLSACNEADSGAENTPPPVRALKTVLIEEPESNTTRRYPSVLQPSEIGTLSFEVAGKLGENNLAVGQTVKQGDVLVELDPTSLELAVGQAEAALEQAKSTAQNAAANLKRQQDLYDKKIIAIAALERAQTDAQTSKAQVAQAEKQLDSAKDNLSKTQLTAPYDGIINSVSADSFSTVNAGTPIATIYSPKGFEASFTVNYEIAQRLTVGKPLMVTLADNPGVALPGSIKELGLRADSVSSFPVIAKIDDVHPDLKSGMAVEISMDIEITKAVGYVIPITALIHEGQIDTSAGRSQPLDAQVYIYDGDNNTVVRKGVKIGGISGNEIVVVAGLEPGDRVASAGIPFLREGMKVKLLEQK